MKLLFENWRRYLTEVEGEVKLKKLYKGMCYYEDATGAKHFVQCKPDTPAIEPEPEPEATVPQELAELGVTEAMWHQVVSKAYEFYATSEEKWSRADVLDDVVSHFLGQWEAVMAWKKNEKVEQLIDDFSKDYPDEGERYRQLFGEMNPFSPYYPDDKDSMLLTQAALQNVRAEGLDKIHSQIMSAVKVWSSGRDVSAEIVDHIYRRFLEPKIPGDHDPPDDDDYKEPVEDY